MKYVIMCGGVYEKFKTPKPLSVVCGERLVDRTIRLLRKNGIEEVYVSSQDPTYDECNATRLIHNNTLISGIKKTIGYWLDAFYPDFEKGTQVCYLFGDVYYTENAIKTIVNYNGHENTLFGTGIAKNKLHKNWGEPFAYKVYDYETFMNGVKDVKKLFDEGKIKRHPIVWELYRYLNNLDINIQDIVDKTYVVIDDGTMDVDSPEGIEILNKKFGGK